MSEKDLADILISNPFTSQDHNSRQNDSPTWKIASQLINPPLLNSNRLILYKHGEKFWTRMRIWCFVKNLSTNKMAAVSPID